VPPHPSGAVTLHRSPAAETGHRGVAEPLGSSEVAGPECVYLGRGAQVVIDDEDLAWTVGGLVAWLEGAIKAGATTSRRRGVRLVPGGLDHGGSEGVSVLSAGIRIMTWVPDAMVIVYSKFVLRWLSARPARVVCAAPVGTSPFHAATCVRGEGVGGAGARRRHRPPSFVGALEPLLECLPELTTQSSALWRV
jgi:hypothetical protein